MPTFFASTAGWIISIVVAASAFIWAIRLETYQKHAIDQSLPPVAALSFFVGLMSLVLSLHYDVLRTFLFHLIAIITGIVGVYTINHGEGKLAGRSLAVGGILLGGMQAFLFFLSIRQMSF